MKKLIKLIIAFVLVFSTANVHAQSFGIKGGLSFSNMYFDDGVETYSFDMNPGFVFGPTAEFSLVENLSLETGLLLNTKGFKESESETYNSQTYEFNRKMTLYYMDVPITLKPSYDLNGIK